MRAVILALIMSFWAAYGTAQDLTALARILPEETRLDQTRGSITLTLGLSQGVPYRVYTRADPPRLFLELSEVAWTGLPLDELTTREAGPPIAGTLAHGWSGFMLPLEDNFTLEEAELRRVDNGALLRVTVSRASDDAFRAASGRPASSVVLQRVAPSTSGDPDAFTVVIDPGHGGVDPGAERGGVVEADLMLVMARELRDALRRATDFEVYLTREEDAFVSLPARAGLARQLRADAFVSLHADALEEGYAEGATIYTLAETATDAASALLAERHNRADIIAGVNLDGQDDEIARILLELARAETTPRSERLAVAFERALARGGARLNTNPRRAADFAVLRSADVPSVLVEVGFLSSEKDRIELQSPEKRGRIIQGLVEGLSRWAEQDAAERALLRQ